MTDDVTAMLIGLGGHLKRIERHLGLKKMTPKEYKLHIQVEDGDEPFFEILKKHGKHIQKGGSWFTDAVDWVKDNVAPVVTNPLVKGIVKTGIGFAPGGAIANGALSAVGYGDEVGNAYRIGGDDIGNAYRVGGDNEVGEGWFDDVVDFGKKAYNTVAPIAQIAAPIVTNPLVKGVVKTGIGLAPGGKMINSGLSMVGYGDDIGDAYRVGGSTRKKRIKEQYEGMEISEPYKEYKIGHYYKLGGKTVLMTANGFVQATPPVASRKKGKVHTVAKGGAYLDQYGAIRHGNAGKLSTQRVMMPDDLVQ